MVSGLMILLVAASLPASFSRYQTRRDLYRSEVAKRQAALYDARDYRSVSAAIERPADPLFLVAEGLGETYGSTAVARGRHGGLEVRARERIDALAASEKTLDLAGLVGVFLTLLALLTSYRCVSGERETGTLAWTVSNSLSRLSLLLGEFLGCLASLMPPLLGAVGVGMIMWSQAEDLEFGSEENVRLLILAATALLLLTAVLWMGLTFSALARGSATSFILCFGLWVLMSLVYPNLVWWMTSYGGPLESEFVGVGGLSVLDLASRPLKDEQIDARKRDSEREANLNRKLEKVQMADSLTAISPLGAFQSAAQILCRSGVSAQLDFIRQARGLNSEFSRWQTEKLARYPEREKFYRPSWGPLDLEGLPVVEFRNASLEESLGAALTPLAVLFAYNVLFFSLAAIAAARYDVRPG